MTNIGEYIYRIVTSTILFFLFLELIAIVGDCLSLLTVRYTVGRRIKKHIRISTFWKIFGFTNITYFLGISSICIMKSIALDFDPLVIPTVLLRLVFGPNDKYGYMYYIFFSILISFLANVLFNFFFVFKIKNFSKIKRLVSTLIVSTMTAPYFFYFTFEAV